MWVKKKQLEPDMKQVTGSKLATIDCSNIVILLIYLHAEYIMWNAGQEETEARIKKYKQLQICR